ncbi:calcium-binding protein [Rhizobacter sp. SG703]|uniref:calcium-binding protein n=1 Tax=Rhizobacter sp. SG703 TaxID=2587140 RepID=UPI001446DB1C|nr:calcium-binding protein [Rhizobacter sp. SG703]NKI93255.1 Ca2+-binding RTX toxin-like protein [Rhizobacter sp. SG703]
MEINSIHNAFINALLADATYVDGLVEGGIPVSGAALVTKLQNRLTPDLAKYFSSHFDVIQQYLTDDLSQSGFDVTVFRSKADGQVFVSTRGTEGLADFAADGDLTLNGLARAQVVDMVNWWLRARTPAGVACPQIKVGPTSLGSVGIGATAPAVGDGTLSAVTSVVVNGHSLGGHLATAFGRIFGDSLPILHVYTYNSATFNPLSGFSFDQIEAALGMGVSAFPNGGVQTNFYATHGPDLTTQNITLGQIGLRIGLFNEESLDVLTVPNHFMFKLTDALALGDFLATLDPQFDLGKLSAMYEAASSNRNDALEGAIDSVATILRGVDPDVPIGDAGDSPPSRVAFHAALATLRADFEGLAGKIHIESSGLNLASKARADFGSLVSLLSLGPISLSGTNAANQASLENVLKSSWGNVYTSWQSDRSMSKERRDGGAAIFTDGYLSARSEMLVWLQAYNNRNLSYEKRLTSLGGILPIPIQGDFIYQDVSRGISLDIDGVNPGTLTSHYVRFGGEANDFLSGGALSDRLFGGGGADQLNGGDGDDYLEGGAAFDSLYGEKGNDTLLGGQGGDWLEGGVGADELKGGEGIDTYRFGTGWGHDVVEDSDGQGVLSVVGFESGLPQGKKVAEGRYRSANEKVIYSLTRISDSRIDLTISFSDRRDEITVRNWTSGSFGLTFDEVPVAPVSTQVGNTHTSPNDQLAGASDSDSLVGLSGNDALSGLAGDDVLEGGDGSDVLAGGAGADVLNGGAGDDYIFGSSDAAGAHWSETATSWVTIDGTVWRIPGVGPAVSSDQGNVIDAGEGNDWVAAGTASDVVRADAGNDLVYGMGGNDYVDGGDGADELHGDSVNTAPNNYNTTMPEQNGDDVLVGGAGNDTLIGEGGSDELYGGDDDDDIEGDAASDLVPASIHGNDYLDGGSGNDRLWGEGGDDDLFGGSGDDTLTGDAVSTALDGADHGNDYLDGEEGDDLLFGNGGDDTLFGGADDDQLVGDTAADAPNFQLESEYHGDDYLDGEDGQDTLIGAGGADTLYGGDGDDELIGDDDASRLAGEWHGDDYLNGEDGDDLL